MLKKILKTLLVVTLSLGTFASNCGLVFAAEKQELSIAVVTTDADNDLYVTLNNNYKGIQLVSTLDAALALNEDADSKNDVTGIMVLADNYPNTTTVISAEQATKIETLGVRLYVEYPANNDTLGITGYSGTKVMGSNRAVVTDANKMNMTLYSLLYVNGAQYVAKTFDANKAGTTDNNVWLVSAKVAGYDVGEYALTNTSPYVLLEEKGNVLVATTKFSQWISARYAPYERYQEFWKSILSWLTNGSVQKMEWELAVKAAHEEDAVLTIDDYVQAVINNSDWFFNSGFLLSDTDAEAYKTKGAYGSSTYVLNPDSTGDGSNGVIESFSSGAQFNTDGSQKIRFLRRADCTGETAGALAMAYYSTGDVRYKQAAYNLVNWLFNESSLANGARADVNSPQYGLLDWDDASNTPEQYYGDDNAKAILGLIEAIAVLGEDGEQFQQRLLESIIANFRTSGVNGFRGNNINASALESNGWEYYYNAETVNYASHFESLLWACYLWAYEQTGWEPLLERTKTGIEMMMKAYDNNQWKWTNGMQQERAKMILALAWLVRLEPTTKHEEWLHQMINDIMMFQQDNGGIQERLGTGAGTYGSYKSNSAYGGSEAPVIQNNGDPCVDNLYTQGFAMLGLNEAIYATSNTAYKAEYTQYFDKLTEFAVKTQQVSDVYSAYDGVWFRAFDYDKWETYGSDGDHEWGVWTTETGWTQAWLSSGISMQIKNTNIMDLSSTMDLSDDFVVVKELMLQEAIVNEGNVALDKTVVYKDERYDDSAAVDGSVTTSWESDAVDTTPTVVVDLEARYNLTDITVVSFAEEYFSTFKVFVSNDNETWTQVGVQNSTANSTKSGYAFTLSANNTRYIKIENISKTSGKNFIVNEVRAYGEKLSSNLEDAVIAAENIKNVAAYTDITRATLSEAIAAAKAVLANASATSQQITDAENALKTAVANLKLKSADYTFTYTPSLGKMASNNEASLMDNVFGQLSGTQYFANGTWMGIEGKDLTIVVDMKEVKFLNSMSLGFLEEYPWGIMYPEYVEFSTSLDNTNYSLFEKVTLNKEFVNQPSNTHTVETGETEVAARYIKIFIKNGGKIPTGHEHAGSPTWFFFDELVVNYSAGNAALEVLVDECEAIDLTPYTEASKAVFTTALNAAKAVLANTSATDEEIYNALTALTEALEQLDLINKEPTITYTPALTRGGTNCNKNIMDGIYGALTGSQWFANGTWAGQQNSNLQVDIDLKEKLKLSELSLGFLKEGKWGINYPSKVTFLGSVDGTSYSELGVFDFSTITSSEQNESYRIKLALSNTELRYVRILIERNGEWFFFDEFAYVLDKTELQSLVTEASSIDRTIYTDESLKVLDKAVEKAEVVIANDKATMSDINEATEELKNAKTDLVSKEVEIKYTPALTRGGTNGNKNIMDGVYGALTGSQWFANGTWAGQQNSNLQIDINLKEVKTFNEMSLGFLKEGKWGINYPSQVIFEVSEDGVTYSLYGSFDFASYTSTNANESYRVVVKNEEIKGQYVRITILRNGEWFFFDEFEYVEAVDKSELQESIDEAGAVNTELYTDTTLKVFNEALENAIAVLNNKLASEEVVAVATQALEEAIAGLVTKKLEFAYSAPLTRGSADMIYDGVYGALTGSQYFANGTWAGMQNSNLQVVIDLREVKAVEELSLGFLREAPFGINYPAKVKFEVSENGTEYKEVGTVNYQDVTVTSNKESHRATVVFNEEKARYVRISIERNGEWFFFDEFEYVVAPDRSELKALVTEVEALDKELYTPTSYEVVEEALMNAKAVLDKTRVILEELTEATTALKDAKDGLTTKAYEVTYTPNLSNGGTNGGKNVVDGVTGTMATDVYGRIFANGTWAGQQNSNLEMVIDLREAKKFDTLSISFLQEPAMGINYPSSVKFEVSNDGTTYELAGEVSIPQARAAGNEIYTALVAERNTTARYVRVTITRSGSNEWFFFDEVSLGLLDVTALEEAIEMYDTVDESLYTPNSFAAYEEVISEAKETMENKDATQEEIDEATEKANQAYDELQYKALKDELSALIIVVKAVDKDDYTKESYNALEKVLEQAEEVLEDDNASQEEVDEALAQLVAAKDSLVGKQVDTAAESNSTGWIIGLLSSLIAGLGFFVVRRRYNCE